MKLRYVMFVMLYVVVCCITGITTAQAQQNKPLTGPVSMRFNEVPLSTLVTFYYKQLLGENFILAKELVANSSPVTLDLKGIEPGRYREIFQQLFEQYGVRSESRNGVWHVSLAVPGSAPVSPSVRVLDEPLPEGGFARESPPVSRFGDALPLDESELKIYRPRARRPGDLQVLVNKLLRTDYAPSDRVFLRGQEKAVSKVLALLEEYDDAPAASVKVQALLLEFSDTSTRSRSFSLALSALGGRLGVSFGPTAALGNFVKLQAGSLSAVLSALEGDSRFQLVDSPNALCDHGESCRIQVGSENPLLGSVSVDRNGNPQQSIVYRDAGSILEVTPEIMQRFIRLKLRQQISNFSKNQLSGIDSPVILKRAIDSTLTLQDGDIIVMGGLDQSRVDSSKTGLSFLPSFLDSVQDSKQSTQLLLVLQIERVKVSEGGS